MFNPTYKATILILFFSLSTLGCSYAQDFYDPVSNTHIVGPPAMLFDSILVSENTIQEKEFWCWAASAQALLSTQGFDISQQEVVQATMGQVVNRAATAEQVRQAVDGHMAVVNGQRVRTRASFVNSLGSILNDLRESRPLIVGFEGHAYVLSAAEYRITPEGKTQILKVILRDPWPSNPNRQEWDFMNFFLRDPIIIRVESQVM